MEKNKQMHGHQPPGAEGPAPARQRAARWREELASLAVAGAMALAVAAAAEGLCRLAGTLLGEPAWQRHWMDQHLPSRIAALAPAGALRDVLAGAVLFFPFLLWPGRKLGPTLIARYDGQLLQPPALAAVPAIAPPCPAQAWQQLHSWCFAGAGTGHSPFWHPHRLAQVPQRFSVALLGSTNGAHACAVAAAWARALDGSLQLQACSSRLDALRLRWRVKRDNCCWWRARQDSDPWDSGYLRDSAAARARLALFVPRRATLVIADALAPAALRLAIETLHARQAAFPQPVRLLIVNAVQPDGLGAQRDAAGTLWFGALAGLGAVTEIAL